MATSGGRTFGTRACRRQATLPYYHTIRGERFIFDDLRTLLARANELKSGDCLAGVAARSERERVAAKCALANVPLAEIVARPLLDPDVDDVSRLILESFDRDAFQELQSWTVGELRERLLDDAAD